MRVQLCARSRRQAAHDRVTDQRVLELERTDVAQDPGAHELCSEHRGPLRIDTGQPRGGDQRRPIEHRDRTGQPDRPVSEPRERGADRARDRVRSHPRHRVRVVGPKVAKPGGQPPDQQWIAAGGAVARVDERGGRRRSVALRKHSARRLPRQRGELDRCHRGCPAKRAVLRRDRRPPGRQQQDRQVVEPVREKLQEPDGGAVGPVQIVDDQHVRPLFGQGGHNPVQAVQHAEGRVGVDLRQRAAGKHDRRRQRAGPVKRPTARGGGHATQPRFQQLTRDSPRVRDLQIRTASARHRDVALPRRSTRQLEQARLPDPRRPFHHDHSPSPRDRLIERIDDRLQLRLTLKKTTRHPVAILRPKRWRQASETPRAETPGSQYRDNPVAVRQDHAQRSPRQQPSRPSVAATVPDAIRSWPAHPNRGARE